MQTSFFEQFDASSPVGVLDSPQSIDSGSHPGPDPAVLRFEQFRLKSIFDAVGKIKNHALWRQPFPYIVTQLSNEYPNGVDRLHGSWDAAVESGRSYLVGIETPMKEFLRRHTSSMSEWQKLAYDWCLANPNSRLVLKSAKPSFEYHAYKRGEYVEIGLPHQEAGGEKHWISRDGKRKVLVNVD